MNDRDLSQLYRRAIAHDTARPSRRVRESILAHAARVASARPKPLGVRAGLWLARVWASSRTGSWQIVAPLAAAALAVAILVPIWRSSVPSGAPSISDENATATVPGPRTAPAQAPPSTAAQSERRLDSPAVLLPARPEAPAATLREGAGADVAPAAVAPTSERARSAPALSNENAAELGASARRSSVAGTQRSNLRDRDAPMRQIQQAVLSGDTERLASLLNEYPTLIDAGDELGRTPLMLATLSGQGRAVELLLAHGANPNISDSAGRLPLEVARAQGQTAIAAELMRTR